MIILLPIIILFGVGILIPYHDLFVNAIGMMEILILFIIFGMLYFPLRNSTIYKNIKLHKNGDLTIYFATFLTCFFVAIIVAFFQIFILALFSSQGWIFRSNFSIGSISPDSDISVNWANVNWLVVFYFFVMTLILTFIFAIIIKTIFNNPRLFYVIILTYFFIDLFWGGTLMSAYTTWNIETNDWPSDVYEKASNTFTFNKIVSMIFPQYYLNQFAFYVFRTGGTYLSSSSNLNPGTIPIIAGNSVSLSDFNYFSFTKDWQWNLNLIVPPLFISAYLILLFCWKLIKSIWKN